MTNDIYTLTTTDFHFKGQDVVYHGKVRDVYFIGDRLISIATDRISAFDHILPKPIPSKGQVLNQIAAFFLRATEDICPNWLEATPDPNVSIGKKCEPIRIEMVIRGYLSGHAARVYKSGIRTLCGISLPDGLNENDKLPSPIITPAIKNLSGHDEDASREQILAAGIVSGSIYSQLEDYTRRLFDRGTDMAASRGLILVDTKYEFGIYRDQIMLIDEIHTPDSSRYFYSDGYAHRQLSGQPQQQLSKEFVREWLIANHFQGLEGQMMPKMPDDFVKSITDRYIALYERLTGLDFIPYSHAEINSRIEVTVNDWLRIHS